MSDQPQSKIPETPDGTSLPAGTDQAQSQIEPDEVNVGLLTIVGALGGVVVLLIVVLLQAWFYNWRDDLTTARAVKSNDPQMPLGRALIEQQEQINSYHWINREAKRRAIPIERAMELVARELAAPPGQSSEGVRP